MHFHYLLRIIVSMTIWNIDILCLHLCYASDRSVDISCSIITETVYLQHIFIYLIYQINQTINCITYNLRTETLSNYFRHFSRHFQSILPPSSSPHIHKVRHHIFNYIISISQGQVCVHN